MKSLLNARDRNEILERLAKVRPNSQSRWGKMSAHQMICHLSDSLRAGLGEKYISPSTNLFTRTILKTLALEPLHGWGISQRIQQLSHGVFEVNPGSLFPAFRRLERAGHVGVQQRRRPEDLQLDQVPAAGFAGQAEDGGGAGGGGRRRSLPLDQRTATVSQGTPSIVRRDRRQRHMPVIRQVLD